MSGSCRGESDMRERKEPMIWSSSSGGLSGSNANAKYASFNWVVSYLPEENSVAVNISRVSLPLSCATFRR